MVGRGIYTNIIDRSYDKFLPEESEWVKKNEYVAPEQIVELFKQHNSNYQDDKILDAGCGTGAVAKLLNAKKQISVFEQNIKELEDCLKNLNNILSKNSIIKINELSSKEPLVLVSSEKNQE